MAGFGVFARTGFSSYYKYDRTYIYKDDRRDASPNVERRHPWRALAVLLTGNFVTILDLFIVNVALPSIQQGLSAADADLRSWWWWPARWLMVCA